MKWPLCFNKAVHGLDAPEQLTEMCRKREKHKATRTTLRAEATLMARYCTVRDPIDSQHQASRRLSGPYVQHEWHWLWWVAVRDHRVCNKVGRHTQSIYGAGVGLLVGHERGRARCRNWTAMPPILRQKERCGRRMKNWAKGQLFRGPPMPGFGRRAISSHCCRVSRRRVFLMSKPGPE